MFVLCLFVVLSSSSCERNTSESEMARHQEQLLAESQRQLGLPNIVNFQEKKLAKMIFELRDQENLVCYAYLFNNYSGKLVFIGKCIGYGLPYSIQYTNPEKLVNRYGEPIDRSNVEVHKIPQADPNGLYMPQGLSATWLMLIDPKTGEPRPVYVENEIIVSPFELTEQ